MKIGITGSTCSGKTTLINFLQFKLERLRQTIEIVPERAMECPYPRNRKGGFRTQWWIQSQHILKEFEAQNRVKVVITDRTVFDGIAYLKIAPHTIPELDFVINTAKDWNENFPYSYIFYLAPITNIGLKDGAKKLQSEIDEKLRTIISSNIEHNKIIYIPYQEKEKRCEYALKILVDLILERQNNIKKTIQTLDKVIDICDHKV